MNTFIERILSRAKSLPEVWQRIDAMTEPGPDASPAARFHYAALKLLQVLSGLAGSRIDQQPTSLCSFSTSWWNDAHHYRQRLSPYVNVGRAHDAVLCLTDVFGGDHTPADGFDATVPHTIEEWAEAMVPVPPCEVPSEPELRAMAEACVAEFSGHWDRLGPTPEDTLRMQTILKLVGPQGCKAKVLAQGLFKQGWGGSRDHRGNHHLTPDAGALVNTMIPRLLRREGSGGHSRYVLGCAPAGVPAEIRAHLWPRQE